MHRSTTSLILAMVTISVVSGPLLFAGAATSEQTYVVTVKPDASIEGIPLVAKQMAAAYGGTIVNAEGAGEDTFVMRLPQSRMRVLAADPHVKSVAPTGFRPEPQAVVETVNWSSGVAYSYDGSGNISQIGNDVFVYDGVSRLVKATVNGVNRTYQYDAYGNRTACTQFAPNDCQGFSINAAENKNRIAGAGYDPAGAGNVTSLSGHLYSYDPLNMMTRDSFGALAREFVYTADDERIATYTVGSSWNWTVRGTDGKVLREFASNDGPAGVGSSSWRWTKDNIWRNGLLLASRQPDGATTTTYHYHLDHLGTPRRVTDQNDRIIGVHDYLAFGPELSGSTAEPSASSLKYTGHERDSWSSGTDSLDYMHARYYSPWLGRFMSVDPTIAVQRNMHQPQGWNRYDYALNSPLTRLDPNGMKDTIYIINTVGGDAFNARALSALNAAVKGTRFEGHVKVIGPNASRGMLQSWTGHADKSDMVGVLIHSGSTKDWKPSLGGFMMTQANLGDVKKGVSGATLGNWLSKDGSTPAACMIGGCHSQQIAATVSASSGTTAFGTTNAVGPGETGMAVAATLGAMAQGKSPEDAAAAGSEQYTTPPTVAYCHGAGPGCDPTTPPQVKSVHQQ